MDITSPAPFRVCVPFRDPGPEMDDCIESIFRQDTEHFEAVFIDDGSCEDHAQRIPLEDPRFSFIRHTTSIGSQACIYRYVSEHCDPKDIVIQLLPRNRFADRESLSHIRAAFEDKECVLGYGQYRLFTGEPGNAKPAQDEAAFVEQGHALASLSPLAFRAELLIEAQAITSQAAATSGSLNVSHGPEFELPEILFRSSGFNRTRFLDCVLTEVNSSRLIANEAVGNQKSLRIETSENQPAQPFSPALDSTEELPKISCLIVTRDRLALVKRSILSFMNQTYPNRELVIVTDGEVRFRQSIERFVDSLQLAGVRFVYPSGGSDTLGYLRNVSMDAANGEIVCQWDDDDYSHPERLAIQARYMQKEKARACFMTDHLQFLEDRRTLFWIDWSVGGRVTGRACLVPGTLMMFRDIGVRYPEQGRYARRGEDTVLLAALYNQAPIAQLRGMGYLYLYQFHGRNTFPKEHHYRMSNYATPATFLEEKANVIRSAAAHYPIPRPITVMGRDRPAYTLS
jgi:glycosyltransferase involved in cell wall biosynthesis